MPTQMNIGSPPDGGGHFEWGCVHLSEKNSG